MSKDKENYDPFTEEDAFRLRGEWIIDPFGEQTMIIAISKTGVRNIHQSIDFNGLLYAYKFINGSICGHKK